MEIDNNEPFVVVKQEPDIYTLEEWINQYSLNPGSFANTGDSSNE